MEYVRRKAFSVLLRFNSLEEAQNQLSTTCSRINTEESSLSTVAKQAKLAAELAALRPCYNEMGCFELDTYKVDVKIYSEKLVILYKNQKVAVHQRIYHPVAWSVRLEHYLNTLLRKPGAVDASLALQKMPEQVQQLFNRQFADSPKNFVLLMQYTQEQGFVDTDILEAYQDLKTRGIRQISADQVKAMMHALTEPQQEEDAFLHPKVTKEQSADIEDGSLQISSKLSQMMDSTITTNESYKN